MADLAKERDHWEMYAKRLQGEITQLRKELVDVTARSIQGRSEAWDLIDKMIPYLVPTHAYRELLAEIEEKRKPHG